MVAQRPKPFENGDGKYGSGDSIPDSSEKGNIRVLFQIKENLPNKDQPTTTVYLEKVSLLDTKKLISIRTSHRNPGSSRIVRLPLISLLRSVYHNFFPATTCTG